MAKRTTLIVAVFAALLSVTLSVQADDYDYYWTGASDSNYLTTGNWKVGSPSGQEATFGLNTGGNNITAYMYNTNGDVSLNNYTLGTSVYSLNIGNEVGTGNTSLTYSLGNNFTVENGKTLSIYDGGTLTFNSSKRFVNKGTVNLNSGANFIVTAAEAIIVCGNGAELNIYDGSTLMVNNSAVPTYLGTNDGAGTINQTGGEATFKGTLEFGWGSEPGNYNLSGGVLNTTSTAGLSCYSSQASTFTVSGGTANFDSFAVGFNGSNASNPGNTFTISSAGTVNVANTFSIAQKGTLNINGGEFNAKTITVDGQSSFKMTAGKVKVNAINMNNGTGTFTQSGGSLVYNGKLTVTGSAELNGSIDLSHFLASYNQTVDVVETTAGVSGNYTVTGDDWTTASDGNKITATYTGGNNNYYWTGKTNNVYYTASNWNQGGNAYGGPTSDPGFLDDRDNPSFEKNCYILTTGSNVNLEYSTLGVASLTIGNGVGGTAGTAVVSRSGNIDVQTNLIVNKGGTLSVSDALTVTSRNNTPGTLTVNGGTFNANSTTEVTGNLIVNDGNYNANGKTTVNSAGKITINGGKFTYSSSSIFVNNGTMTLTGDGEFVVNSGSGTFRVGGANNNAKFDITGGKATFNTDVYIATSSNGTINQSGGETVFNSQLALGWGGTSGTYNLTGGTINTNAAAGLWTGNDKGVSTFNVDGGTANFKKSGESFTIGLGGSNSLANVFNLYSGTVNAADTFAIQNGGTLKVAKNGQTGGNGVLNAKGITLSNNGNLTMSSGTINLGSGGITNSGSYTITLSGGTFGTNYASWSSGLTATIASDKTVTFDPDAGRTITWSGVLSGSGAISKTGAGTLELTGANTYSGGTTITNGELRLRQSGTLGAQTGTVNIDTNGQLTFGGDMTPQPKTIANAISGTGTIVKQGASNFTVNLDGNLTGFIGDMTISGGTLSVLMNETNKSLKVTNLSGPGNLELRISNGAGNIEMPNLQQNENDNFTGVISLVDNGVNDGSKFYIDGNDFNGFTFKINEGTTLYFEHWKAPEAKVLKANVLLFGNGNNENYGALRVNYDMSGKITVMDNNATIGIDRNNNRVISGNIVSGAESDVTLSIQPNWAITSGTFSGNISDGDTSKLSVAIIQKSDATGNKGTFTFSGNLSYTGETSVATGQTLNLTGTGTNLVNSSAVAVIGTLDVTGYTGSTTMQLNNLTGAGNVNLGAKSLTLNNNTADGTVYRGVINGTGNVTKSGAGTLTLTQAPAYTGSTTIEDGTLDLAAGGTLYGLSGAGTVSFGSNALTLSNAANADSTFAGSFEGTGNVTKTGAGTLTLSQEPAYTGSTTVEAGTLNLTAGGTLYNLKGGALNEETGEPLVNAVIKAIDGETKKDLVLSNDEMSKFIGSITAKKITKDGDGTLKLYAESSDSGISADKFIVSSGRLDIKGYLDGTLEVEVNAVFSPGNSVGEATFGGGYILKDGAKQLIEVGKNGDNVIADTLVVTGAAEFYNNSIIEIGLDNETGSQLKGGDTFTATITADSFDFGDRTFDVFKNSLRSYFFTDLDAVLDDTASPKVITITGRLDPNAVPEPSTWTLLLLGAAGMMYWRKRKNAK